LCVFGHGNFQGVCEKFGAAHAFCLCAENENSPLKAVFFNDHYTTASLMIALRDFFKKLKDIGKDADKMKISNKNGDASNIAACGEHVAITDSQRAITLNFVHLLSELTGWIFDSGRWNFADFTMYKFTKGSIKPNGKNFKELIAKNPLSWAMTSTLAIEYTLEKPDKMKQENDKYDGGELF
jgi:hypothetical protein